LKASTSWASSPEESLEETLGHAAGDDELLFLAALPQAAVLVDLEMWPIDSSFDESMNEHVLTMTTSAFRPPESRPCRLGAGGRS